MTTQEAKLRLPMRALMARLGIPVESIPERDGKTVRCPWPQNHAHGDRNPAFNTYKGGTSAKCFACGVNVDGPALVSLWLGISKEEGFAKFMEMAGCCNLYPGTLRTVERPQVLTLPKDRHYGGGDAEDRVIARSRGICHDAVALARAMNVLCYGTVCNFPCWILTDCAQKLAEARRLDGKPFPAVGPLGERKAHTLKGSCKNWPVGAALLKREISNWRAIMLVEGTPDYLAALHFCIERDAGDVLPVAMLGRQAGRIQIHPEAIELLRTKRVCIYPHADKDGGGMDAAKAWAEPLARAGSKVDIFPFEGLKRRDGALVNDLNDAVLIHPEHTQELENILP